MALNSLLRCFGKLPTDAQLDSFHHSPRYINGKFYNQVETPLFSQRNVRWSLVQDLVCNKNKYTAPTYTLPMLPVDFSLLDLQKNMLIWLGHSSYYLQLDGKRILIDPVLSSYAAPVPFVNRAFERYYPYSPRHLPAIDLLLISHDHWDHLDYATLMQLKTRIKQVVVPLGVDAHLRYWGFDDEQIHALDWYDAWQLDTNFVVHAQPARHFSGRGLTRDQTLWASYLLDTTALQIFYSGDSGYGAHFAEIGQRFTQIDLAIMENGQYDKRWAYVHMTPEQTAQASEDLRAKVILPAHSGRFSLARHAWDDPYRRLVAASQGKPYRLATPKMGEVFMLANLDQAFAPWWEITSE